MALTQCFDLWRCFINAQYLTKTEAEVKCQHCQSKRPCNNYYCLACKEGGLCPTKFKANQAHDHHPYLQVRQLTHEDVVNVGELEAFLGANAHKMQKFRGNDKDTIKLKMSKRSKEQKSVDLSNNMRCGRCDMPFTKTARSQEGAIVCSIECLIIYAEDNHQMDLLKLKDGVDLQIYDYAYPLTAQEKIDFMRHKKMKECVDVSEIGVDDNGRARHVDEGRNQKKNLKAPSKNEKEDEAVRRIKKRRTKTSRTTVVANPSDSKAQVLNASVSQSTLVANPRESKATLATNPRESKATLVANPRESKAILVANQRGSEAQVPITSDNETPLEISNRSESETTLVANPNESQIVVPNPNESEPNVDVNQSGTMARPHYDFSIIPIGYTNPTIEMMFDVLDI